MEQENLHHDEDGNKDSEAIQEVINKVKSQGLFDQFRKECLADVDTKPAYHNLIQRVEKFVERFLNGQKWTSNVNKNQLRETLRRQLNNSGIMSIGVDRIIEQVVNPKILLGIKPRIDEAVCEHLGIDLKSRQEEQQRRKQEKQRLMLQNQQLHQQHMQDMMNQNMKNDESFSSGSGILPTPNDMSWSPGNSNFLGGPGPGMGPGSGVPYNMGFGGMMQPFSFMGPWGPGLPGMEGFNQTMNPMIPGQPMIPPFPSAMPDPAFNTSPRPAQSTPDFSKPPPGLQGSPLMNANSSIASSPGVPGLSTQSSPVAPPGIHPVPVGPIIRPPPPGSVPPPPGTVPVMAPLIPPGAPMAPPVSPLVRPNVPTTPNIPALISHTLSKVSKDELTPEKIAVFKTAAAFITKTVSNAQGTPGGADLATMFSPRVLAEAMMAESGVPLSKHEIRAAKRKERMKEYERLKAERDKEEAAAKKKEAMKAEEDPLPPKHNLMDVFQAAEDVSDDEEAFNMLIDESETEDRHKQGIVLSEDSDKEEEEQPPTIQPGKRYNFAWDVDKDGLSDVTVSSIHTSDISSFDTSSSESLSEEDDKPSEATEENLNQEDKEDNSQINADMAEPKDEKPAEVITTAAVPDSKETKELAQAKDTETKLLSPETEVKLKGSNEMAKPRKLVSLSYRYSDSEEEETREERKARIAKEKEERYLKRQQRRAEMEAKRKEREDEKARLKEEKKKLEEDKKDETQIEAITDDVSKVEDPTSLTSVTDQESPNKSSPKKRRKKAELKEQLHQQKVLERKAALSRQRTRNRRYASEEFTSIFTERKSLNQSYTDPPADIVTFDGSLEVVEMTVDQECVVETVSETVDVVDGEKTEDLTLQCPSPYSDISDKSMSSEDQNMAVEMEQVSSDEDLDSGEDIDEDASKDVKSSVEFDETEVSQESSVKNIAPTRSNSTSIDVTDKRKSPELTENRNSRSQRYEVDDLYKPRTNRRRATSPPAVPLESKVIAGTDSQSDDDRFSQKSHSLVSSQTVSQSSEQEAEKVNLVTATAAEEDAGVKEPVDIMADLELEPVSDEETPLEEMCVNNADGAEQEDGEEEDSDEPVSSVKKETPPSTETPLAVPAAGQKEDDDASDEGEIKSSSEDDKIDSEEEKERAAHRKPIELVDFGEAEKRARGSRGYFPEVVDRRPIRGSATHSSYRGGYTWTSTEPPSYVPNVQRYPVSHEGILTSHSKSPLGYDGADSEASSQSRCSVRLRDDVPPPYPIEGVNTRKRRSPLSEVGSSGLYKPVSPPSPVSSSSSSSSSRSVGSYSSSRSRSSSHSRSSSLSSTSSSHSSREKAKRKKKRRRRRSSRNKEVSNVRQKFSSSKSLDTFSPIKGPEIMPKVVSEPQLRERLLSSGHESISSDELPYFPDDEPQPPPSPPKVKVKRRRSSQCDSSTGSSSSKSPVNKKQRCSQSPGKESISSSELIYSPTRLKSPKKMSEAENDDDDNVSIERPPMSPGRSSISSGELPDYPEHDLEGFSPHHPPLQQEDIDRFQPPLPPSPQNFDINPPLPPPSPELPQMPPEPSHSPPESHHLIPEAPPSSPEEDGEITEETEFGGAENSVTEKASCVQMSHLDSTSDTQPEIQCEEPSPQPSLSPKDSAPSKEDIVIPLLEISEHSSSTPPHSEPPLLLSTENYSHMTSSLGISECIPEKVKTAVEETDSRRESSDNTVVECSSINSNTDNRQSLTVVNDKEILPTRVQLSDIETQEQSGIQRDEMLTIDDVSEIPSGVTDTKCLKEDVDEASGTFIGECIQKTNVDHSLSQSLGEEAHEPTALESLGEVREPEASISVDEVHEPEASESGAKVHEPADSESVDRTHEPKASESV